MDRQKEKLEPMNKQKFMKHQPKSLVIQKI